MTEQTFKNQPVTVLGLSKSGQAVARYVRRRGGEVFLSEMIPASPQNEGARAEMENLGVTVEMGGHSRQCFSHSDLVAVSPGIPPTSAVLKELELSGKEIISEVEFAYREVRKLAQKNTAKKIQIIGITGTNGKTTTTTLISEILKAAGLNAPACGNIGLPVATVMDVNEDSQVPDALVIELSSFQLQFSPTLTADVAVFMNFRPDHLDWHGSLTAYKEAKMRLFTSAQSPRWSVVYADDPVSEEIAARTTGNVLWFSRHEKTVAGYANKAFLNTAGDVVFQAEGKPAQTILNISDLKILGAHNHENVLASVSAALLSGVAPETIRKTCENFLGVEHRLEWTATVEATGETANQSSRKRVAFYNDSKATNVDAAVCALEAFGSQPVIYIAGGRDKMTPLEPLADAVKAHASRVILLGEAAARFQEAFEKAGIQNITVVDGFEGLAETAFKLSGGEPVLFSPACASFDMFKNFEERGKAFKAQVLALQKQTASPHAARS